MGRQPPYVDAPMKILLADNHPLVLIGIQQALEADADFEVVGTTSSGPQVLPLVGQRQPDVVLLDTRLPNLDGFGCLARLRSHYPNVKVVMTSVFADAAQVQLAFDRGACGFIIKSIEPADLPSAIRQAVEGTAYHALGLPPANEKAIARAAGLSQRELTIVKAAARGLSNQAIAKELWVTEQTVKFHLTNVYRKLGVANRTEAARWAFANGFIEESSAAVQAATAPR
jgi:DNA-binding NarL/FixJ family response regulator